MTEDHQLNGRAHAWIQAIESQYVSVPIPENTAPVAASVAEVGNFKML